MDNVRHIHPVPPDQEIIKFLFDRREENYTVLSSSMAELHETIEETQVEKQPELFAYGKLLHWLADQPSTEVLRICAAAMWHLSGMETEWNTSQNS